MIEGNICYLIYIFCFSLFHFSLGSRVIALEITWSWRRQQTVMHTPACKGCREGEAEEERDFLYIAWSCVTLPRLLWGCWCNSFLFQTGEGLKHREVEQFAWNHTAGIKARILTWAVWIQSLALNPSLNNITFLYLEKTEDSTRSTMKIAF